MNPFRRRVQLYLRFDGTLGARTRFFGAAALTNAVLTGFLSPMYRHFINSALTYRFLLELGASLEKINVEWARGIAVGSLSSQDLDRDLVAAEQRAVQRHLDRLARQDPGSYQRLLREVDGTLNGCGIAARLARLDPVGSWYLEVLGQVKEARTSRSIRFEQQEDRVAVGLALIQRLRGTPSQITVASALAPQMLALVGC